MTTSRPSNVPGKMPGAEYTFTYPVIYQKGTATATFKFKSADVMNPTGKITGFTLEADAAPDSKQQ